MNNVTATPAPVLDQLSLMPMLIMRLVLQLLSAVNTNQYSIRALPFSGSQARKRDCKGKGREGKTSAI
jgi:hypothetical protein